jgi:hypothetical protein
MWIIQDKARGETHREFVLKTFIELIADLAFPLSRTLGTFDTQDPTS